MNPNASKASAINLEFLQSVLVKLSSQKPLLEILSPEEQMQIELATQLTGFLIEITKLKLRDKIGGFITKCVADEKSREFSDWRLQVARQYPAAQDLLKPLLLFEALGSSAEHIKKLVNRAKKDDYIQISLGKTGQELNCMIAVLDENAHIRLGQAGAIRPQDANIEPEAIGEDYLDDMRPCPPCRATMFGISE